MTSRLDSQSLASALFPLQLSSTELEALCEASQKPPRPAIRLRPGSQAARLPFASELVGWHHRGRFLIDDVRSGQTLEFANGEFYIQDAASLLPLALLDAQPHETICDLCAAPGGKSTGILEDLSATGWLLANESVRSRCGALEFNLARHGLPNYCVSSRDPDQLAVRLSETFDAVLVDAPCSGQSLVGRGKQSLSSFAPQTIDHCAARQTRILDAAARLVKAGGRLVYSTCTFAYVENEGQVESFLLRHPDWKCDPLPDTVAQHCDPSPHGLGARVWPHRQGCGGGFAVALRRGTAPFETEVEFARREPFLHAATLPTNFRDWGELSDVAVFQAGLQLFAWPRDVPLSLIAESFAGPEVAFRKGSTWFPAYGLAMRRDPGWVPRAAIDLDEQQARRFMQGHPLPGDLQGWGVATWQSRPLGWLKGDGRQMKNHLPKPARLN